MIRLFLFAVLSWIICPARGQTFTSAYVKDAKSGCKVWAEYYSKPVTISWNGGCKNKLAEGAGTLIWYYEGKEYCRYTGIMKSGAPHGNGKTVWHNGYVQEGNYFDGHYLNLDSSYLSRVQKTVLPLIDSTDIYSSDSESKALFYYSLAPTAMPQGALVLLAGSSETAASVYTNNVKLIQRANDEGLVIIVPSINNNLALGSKELAVLNATFESAVVKHRIPKDKFIIGGFSLGGLYALRYTQMSNDANFKTSTKPVGVFAADPPVDLARLYDIFKRAMAKNTSANVVAESERYLNRIEQDFGGAPSTHPEKYELYSAFSRSATDGGNAKFLSSVPVRIYSDPDIDWQMKERKGDYFDMGALDQTTMINQLRKSGNTRAEFINALGKGYNPDGSRNPHSWSIIDAEECIQWILDCLK